MSDTVDLATLAKNRQEWSAEVALRTKVSIPVIVNDKQYGSTELAPGTMLRLVEVRGEQPIVSRGQTMITIPVSSTDVVDRVVTARKSRASQ
jgi:hypothetical protein